jgi:hypothetical protein
MSQAHVHRWAQVFCRSAPSMRCRGIASGSVMHLAVNAEEDGDAVASPLGDPGWVEVGVEPRGQAAWHRSQGRAWRRLGFWCGLTRRQARSP